MRKSQEDRWKLWVSVLTSMWLILWSSQGQCGQLLLPAAEAEGAALGANVVALGFFVVVERVVTINFGKSGTTDLAAKRGISGGARSALPPPLCQSAWVR